MKEQSAKKIENQMAKLGEVERNIKENEESVRRLEEKKRYFESKTARRTQVDNSKLGMQAKTKQMLAPKSKLDNLSAADKKRFNEVKSSFAEYFYDKPSEVNKFNTAIENLIRKTKEKHEDMSDILDLLRKVEIKFMRLLEMRKNHIEMDDKEVTEKLLAKERTLVVDRKQETMKTKLEMEKRKKEEERIFMEEKRK